MSISEVETMADQRKRAFSIEQVTQMTGITRPVVYREIKAGRLIARKCGRRTLILAEDLDRYLENLPRMYEGGEAA